MAWAAAGLGAIYVLSVLYYFVTTPDWDIAGRAFTIGSWDACTEGPSLWDRHAASLAFAYVSIKSDLEGEVGERLSLVRKALNVAKCLPADEWRGLETQRVARGIQLGLERGEDINAPRAYGAPLHLAVMAGNLDIVALVVEAGGDPLAEEYLLFIDEPLSPLELARDLDEMTTAEGYEATEIADYLELAVAARNEPQE